MGSRSSCLASLSWGVSGLLAVVLVLSVALSACSKPDPALVKRESKARGDELLAQKQYAEAAAAYRTAVNADPFDGGLRLHLARTHGQAGNWSAARDEAVRAADLMPLDRDAQLYAASLVLAWGGFTDAAHRARALLHDQPNLVPALLIAGNAMARLTNSVSAIEEIEKALRNGLPVGRPLRQGASPADDQEAEALFRRALQVDPAHDEAQLALANLFFATGRDNEGVSWLRQVADRNPQHLFANRAAGVWLLFRGQATGAERYLQAAHSAGDATAARLLADHYTRSSRPERALQILEALPASDDASGSVSVSAAMAELRLGRRADASSRIDRLLTRIPGHAPALRLKAEVLFAGTDIDGAMASAQAAVDAEPRSREGHVLFGRILAANGSHARALAQLEEALRLDSSGDGILPDIAAVALALGRTGEALDYARQAVRRDPADRTATVVLVAALIRSRDLASAERTLAPLLAREPAAADLLLFQGQMLAQGGMVAAARGVLTRALQAAPESVDAIAELVNLDLRDGQIAAARQRADRALAQRPANPRLLMLAARAGAAAADWAAAEPKLRTLLEREPQHAEAAVMLSDHLISTGRRDEATRLLDALLARRPAGTDAATARAAHLLATLYLDQNDRLDQVLELARMARQALPDDPAVSDTLGWVYVRKNLPESAIAHLEDAVRAAPDNARYRYHLGIACLRLGRSHDAQTALTRALQLDSAMPEAPDARAALSSITR
jgi:tetratricopeptide (TPR) repeat protein